MTDEPTCRLKRQAMGLPYGRSNCLKCGPIIRVGWRCAEVNIDPLTCPEGESVITWAAACALAAHRHPHAHYPQPADLADARIASIAIIEVISERILPRGVTQPRWDQNT